MAEREGFEPSVQTSCTTDFESAAFDHSATFPSCVGLCPIRQTLNLLFVCVPQTQISPSGLRPSFISAKASITSLPLIIHSATFPSCVGLCPIRQTLNLLFVCVPQTQISPSGLRPSFISAKASITSLPLIIHSATFSGCPESIGLIAIEDV